MYSAEDILKEYPRVVTTKLHVELTRGLRRWRLYTPSNNVYDILRYKHAMTTDDGGFIAWRLIHGEKITRLYPKTWLSIPAILTLIGSMWYVKHTSSVRKIEENKREYKLNKNYGKGYKTGMNDALYNRDINVVRRYLPLIDYLEERRVVVEREKTRVDIEADIQKRYPELFSAK